MLHKELLHVTSPFHRNIAVNGCFAHTQQFVMVTCTFTCQSAELFRLTPRALHTHAVSAGLIQIYAISYTLMLKQLFLTHFKLFFNI